MRDCSRTRASCWEKETSRHACIFINEESGSMCGSVLSKKYRPSQIPSGGLDIPLSLYCKVLDRHPFKDEIIY